MNEGYYCVKPDAAGLAVPTVQEMHLMHLIPFTLNSLMDLWTQRKVLITFSMEPIQYHELYPWHVSLKV